MTSPLTTAASIDALARRIKALEEQQKAANRSPQLTRSSIDGGAVNVRDTSGQLTAIVGQQYDGSAGAVAVSGPTPPTPSAPTVRQSPGGALVRWDGTFAPGGSTVAPGDFKGVEVWAGDDPSWPMAGTSGEADAIAGDIITSARGAEVFVPWGDPKVGFYARLRTRATTGKVSGFSATVGPVSLLDTTPPAAPTTPIVSSWVGIIKVTWDGKLLGPSPVPDDFLRVDIHTSTLSGFTPSEANRAASMSAGGTHPIQTPYGQTTYVKLVAYDTTGNASAPSQEASGSSSQVVAADVFDGAIGSSKLADLAVVTAKIGDLAVNDAKIGSVSVGKLTAGAITADLVNAGRITTALTGARVEQNALGFQGFRDDGTKWLSLTNKEALITGEFRTAETGRRIEMGVAGVAALIEFVSPTNILSFVKGYTEPNGVDSIQVGIKSGNHFLYGLTNWNENFDINTHGRAIINGVTKEWRVESYTSTTNYNADDPPLSGSVFRLQIDLNGFRVRDPDNGLRLDFNLNESYLYRTDGRGWLRQMSGNLIRIFPSGEGAGEGYFEVANNAGNASNSPRLVFFQGNGGGSMYKSFNGAGEVRNMADTAFAPIRASAFEVNSDAGAKAAITDATFDAEAVVRAMRVRKYLVKRPSPDGAGEYDVEQIGLVAQEAPPIVVTPPGSGGALALDLYQCVSVLILAVQQIAKRLPAVAP